MFEIRRKLIIRGTLITFLVKKNIKTLIFYYLLLSLFIIFLFGILYWSGGYVIDSAKNDQGFLPCLYFSVITQTTLGYGDLSPIGYGRLFAAVQTILGGLYAVLFLGVIVAKMIWPPESIVFSDKVVFDYIEHKFRFRFYNAHKLPLCNTKYTVWIRGVGKSEEQLLHRNFLAKLQFPGHPIIEPHKPWVVNTVPCKDIPLENLDASKTNILFPEHLNPNTQLIIQIEGHYPKIGGQSCFGIQRLKVDDIVCGRLNLVETIDMSGKVIKTNWGNFNSYSPIDIKICRKCKHHGECFLAKRIFE